MGKKIVLLFILFVFISKINPNDQKYDYKWFDNKIKQAENLEYHYTDKINNDFLISSIWSFNQKNHLVFLIFDYNNKCYIYGYHGNLLFGNYLINNKNEVIITWNEKMLNNDNFLTDYLTPINTLSFSKNLNNLFIQDELVDKNTQMKFYALKNTPQPGDIRFIDNNKIIFINKKGILIKSTKLYKKPNFESKILTYFNENINKEQSVFMNNTNINIIAKTNIDQSNHLWYLIEIQINDFYILSGWCVGQNIKIIK